jgi:hypothetical protein
LLFFALHILKDNKKLQFAADFKTDIRFLDPSLIYRM